MNINKLLKDLKNAEPYYIQHYWDKEWYGSCPCFSGRKDIGDKFVSVWGRCWRVSENVEKYGQDLYVWGTINELELVGSEVKRLLDEQHWYNKYRLIFKDMGQF